MTQHDWQELLYAPRGILGVEIEGPVIGERLSKNHYSVCVCVDHHLPHGGEWMFGKPRNQFHNVEFMHLILVIKYCISTSCTPCLALRVTCLRYTRV